MVNTNGIGGIPSPTQQSKYEELRRPLQLSNLNITTKITLAPNHACKTFYHGGSLYLKGLPVTTARINPRVYSKGDTGRNGQQSFKSHIRKAYF